MHDTRVRTEASQIGPRSSDGNSNEKTERKRDWTMVVVPHYATLIQVNGQESYHVKHTYTIHTFTVCMYMADIHT